MYKRHRRHDVPQLFHLDDYADAHRPGPQMLTSDQRHSLHGFDEVELPYDERTIQEECKRCLRCDLDWLEKMGLEPVGLEAPEPVKPESRLLAQPPAPEKLLAVERTHA